MVSFVMINGCGASGKDTFVELCAKHAPDGIKVLNYSTADSAKAVLSIVAANYYTDIPELTTSIDRKDHACRDTLSELKDYLDENFNAQIVGVRKFIVDRILTLTVALEDTVVFIHCREPEKIDALLEYFRSALNYELSHLHYDTLDAIAATLLVSGRTDPDEFTNHADREVMNYRYDYRVENTGTIDDLEQRAIEFMQKTKRRFSDIRNLCSKE